MLQHGWRHRPSRQQGATQDESIHRCAPILSLGLDLAEEVAPQRALAPAGGAPQRKAAKQGSNAKVAPVSSKPAAVDKAAVAARRAAEAQRRQAQLQQQTLAAERAIQASTGAASARPAIASAPPVQ